MILIHQTDEDGSNINSFLVTVDDSTSPIKGHVKITNNQDPTEYVMYAISGALTEVTDAVNGNYFKFNLVYLSGAPGTSGTAGNSGLIDQRDYFLTFARAGDAGSAGSSGSTGSAGSAGSAGTSGSAGSSG